MISKYTSSPRQEKHDGEDTQGGACTEITLASFETDREVPRKVSRESWYLLNGS